MRWQGRRQSSNVDDRRGSRGKKIAVGGGIGTIILVIITLLSGGDLGDVLRLVTGDGNTPSVNSAPAATSPEEDQQADFVKVVLADTEDVWGKIFQQQGNTYREPTLVLFTDTDQSACGYAQAATGPFYCPADQQVYIDLGFQQTLSQQLEAGGDFAMAYVVAHEVGHHVQNLLGITDQMQAQRRSLSQEEYNELSVRLELQADFLAGVWAYHAEEMYGILEAGDIEEAMRAANAIGDDRLQQESQGYVVPDSFTHGTSAQRMRWFKKGFETGDINQGDTFSAQNL